MAEDSKNTASEATKTLDALFFDRVRRMSASIAYKEYDRKRREWRSVSWAGLGLEMTRWRGALEREELGEGARVAIMMENRKEWIIFEQAAMVLDLVVVPIFPNENPETVAYILQDCGAELLLVDDISAWDRLGAIHNSVPALKHVILLEVKEEQEEEVKERDDSRLEISKDWLPVEGGPLHERYSDSNALATIVYTTGTTGRPKGVMLSHLNLLSNARAMMQMLAIRQADTILAHLNYAHIVQRVCSYYAPMMAGAMVAFGRSLENFDHDLVEVHPSILVTESHFMTRLAGKLNRELEEHVFIDRMLFKLAINAGWANFLTEQKRVRFHPMAYLWPMLKGMSTHAIMPKIVGQRLRRVISTGSPMSPAMSKLFVGLSINVLQGYHLTEAGGVVSLNTMLENYTESIGFSLPGFRIKITMDGQIHIANDNSMALGYMGKAADEDHVFRNDWLFTQDMAEYHDQHLFFNGRYEEELEMDGGMRFNPELLEAAIISDVLFDYAMVVGQGSSLVAIVVLNRSIWNAMAASMGLETKEANDPNNSKVHDTIMGHIRAALHTLDEFPEVTDFIISDTAWSVDNGLLTPTLRPRRDEVRKRFAAQISMSLSQANSEAVAAIRSELAGKANQIDVKDDDIPTL
ncbi:MAG: AMP-binding protein [Gammaproteobacteria bacterium]|nr:AMP-binding protein [Gammaproteobacteria bacterium]